MPKSPSLSLPLRQKGAKDNSAPLSPRSPASSRFEFMEQEAVTPSSFHTVPQSPASPKMRKSSKGNIFANFGATKSSTRIATPDASIRQVQDPGPPPPFYTNGRGGGSTPDLSRPVLTPSSEASTQRSELRNGSLNELDTRSEIVVSGPRTNSSSKSHDAPDANQEPNSKRPPKLKKLGRSKSIKVDDSFTVRSKLKANPPKFSPDPSAAWNMNGAGAGISVAPPEKGQSWRQNIGFGKMRTQSADRNEAAFHPQRGEDAGIRRDRVEQGPIAPAPYPEHNKGPNFMQQVGAGARKVGDKMENARKGIFGKLGRSSSNHEKDHYQIPKEPYQFKVIHLPLVEQTRITRISSRLENSKDKTEFWMPALPWRCIDYLNMRGCEEEGLYRVPGAAHQIKFYEQKFDQDHDIDLIADENLNDPNVIGSLFKNWLRQLPDEIFPKAIQAKIQQECQGAKSTPQLLKDELSKLPPFNYYLLFAITCHISLLHSCSEFNKMNYNNLCICFQPAIKIDAFCFQFLILDWRNCWQGCWTEKEYLAEEVKFLEAQEHQLQPPPSRNGHSRDGPPPSIRGKSSHGPSGYLGDEIRPSSVRKSSADRGKPTGRGVSNDRSVSERDPSPNASVYVPDQTGRGQRGVATEREASADRTVSPSNSRETFNARTTPQRGPASVNTESPRDDEDHTATPTQHGRGASDPQFRLDLNNPPGSPFAVKFTT